MPIAVKRGDNANLICNYDMEGDTLYTVKYYKGRREFYRYTPKENPAIKVFPHPGIKIEVSTQRRERERQNHTQYVQRTMQKFILLPKGEGVEVGWIRVEATYSGRGRGTHDEWTRTLLDCRVGVVTERGSGSGRGWMRESFLLLPETTLNKFHSAARAMKHYEIGR